MMPINLSVVEWSGVDLLDLAKRGSLDCFANDGRVDPIYLIEGFRSPYLAEEMRDGHFVIIASTRFVGDSMEEVNKVKEAFARFVEVLALEVRARQLIFVSEAWMATGAKASDLPANLEHHPGREEIIYLIHEKAGSAPVGMVAHIEEVEGKRKVGEFRTAISVLRGRFAHILRQPAKGQA